MSTDNTTLATIKNIYIGQQFSRIVLESRTNTGVDFRGRGGGGGRERERKGKRKKKKKREERKEYVAPRAQQFLN